MQHIKDNLRGLWRVGAETFATELAGAVDRVNYNQPIGRLNALAALVSYLPAADPRLYCIEEGNAQLPARLLDAAAAGGRAALRFGVGVRQVTQLADGRFELVTTSDDPGDNGELMAGCG